jgi:hypothetical protein
MMVLSVKRSSSLPEVPLGAVAQTVRPAAPGPIVCRHDEGNDGVLLLVVIAVVFLLRRLIVVFLIVAFSIEFSVLNSIR